MLCPYVDNAQPEASAQQDSDVDLQDWQQQIEKYEQEFAQEQIQFLEKKLDINEEMSTQKQDRLKKKIDGLRLLLQQQTASMGHIGDNVANSDITVEIDNWEGSVESIVFEQVQRNTDAMKVTNSRYANFEFIFFFIVFIMLQYTNTKYQYP